MDGQTRSPRTIAGASDAPYCDSSPGGAARPSAGLAGIFPRLRPPLSKGSNIAEGDGSRHSSVNRSKRIHHEYPGVGHNCWDLTYAMPDLSEWLAQPKIH